MKKLSVKRVFSGLMLLLMFTSVAYAQNPLHEGMAQLNAGVGFSEWGVPIYLGLDYSVHKDVTIGGEFSYRSYRENWRNNDYNRSIMGFSGNGSYHFNTVLEIPQNFDFYVGLNIGYYVWSAPSGYDGTHNSGVGLGGQIGGRYYFSGKFGINLEFDGGGNILSGKVGVSVKL